MASWALRAYSGDCRKSRKSGSKPKQTWARVLALTFTCHVILKKVISLRLFNSWKKQRPHRAAEIKPGNVRKRVWKLERSVTIISFLLRLGTGVCRKRRRVDFGKSAFTRPKSSLFVTLTRRPSCAKHAFPGRYRLHQSVTAAVRRDLARARMRGAGDSRTQLAS